MLRRSGGCSGFRCPYGCLDVQLAKAILSLECAHALLESRYRRITAHSITDVLTCVPPDLGLQSTWLLTSFFQESISADILYRKSMVRNSASSLSLLLFPMLLLVFATSDIRKSGVRNFMVCYGHNSISHGHGWVDFRQRWGASQFKIRQITEVMFILWAERCHAPKPHSIQLYIESCGKASQVMPGLE